MEKVGKNEAKWKNEERKIGKDWDKAKERVLRKKSKRFYVKMLCCDRLREQEEKRLLRKAKRANAQFSGKLAMLQRRTVEDKSEDARETESAGSPQSSQAFLISSKGEHENASEEERESGSEPESVIAGQGGDSSDDDDDNGDDDNNGNGDGDGKGQVNSMKTQDTSVHLLHGHMHVHFTMFYRLLYFLTFFCSPSLPFPSGGESIDPCIFSIGVSVRTDSPFFTVAGGVGT